MDIQGAQLAVDNNENVGVGLYVIKGSPHLKEPKTKTSSLK